MSSPDSCILMACENDWNKEFLAGHKNSDNCSGFVKSVANSLGISLPKIANADGIMDSVSGSWTKIESGAEAAQKAATGKLVIAGLKSKDHSPARANGHVVIVVSGSLYKNKYPLCWGGSIGSAQSRGTKSVGEVWNRKDRDAVGYYVFGIFTCST